MPLKKQKFNLKYSFAIIGIAILGFAACKKMAGGNQTIQKGSVVQIDYTLKVDGKIVDTSVGKKPLMFIEGSGQIIPGLDSALVGLKSGDQKHVVVNPQDGYGVINPKAFVKVPKTSFKNLASLKVGSTVGGSQNGRSFQATVYKMGKKHVTLDFNPPLAGKTLNFDVTVVSVAAGKS
jgi:FKBP-type peptidyl-prolyl cis-trans isomerase SlyD